MGKMKNPATGKSYGTGKKVLVGIGLFFIIIGVFLGSFVCSFHVMISAESQPSNNESSKSDNAQEEIQLLTDQITILENELERYREIDGESDSDNAKSSNSQTSSSNGSSSKSSSKQSSQDD